MQRSARTLLFSIRIVLIAGLLVWACGATADDDAECRSPRIGLALGSGGAGGLAHIAMLKVFEDLDLRPRRITGTSIGAIIGGLYAAGLSADEISDIFREFGGSALDPFSGWLDDEGAPGLREMIEVDLDAGSLIDAGGFIEFIAKKFNARDFAELRIPMTMVATDYWSGQQHVMREGDLLTAMRASMAVPGLFAPVRVGDKLLIDGGVSNPLPIDLLDDVDVIVAIDVTGTRREARDGEPDISDLLFKTFEIMQQSIVREKTKESPPDIHIKPELANIRLLHFDRVDQVLEQAAPAAEELRAKLKLVGEANWRPARHQCSGVTVSR